MPGPDEVVGLYGPWRHRAPADALELLRGYPGTWWIAGGWAIDAFTDRPRPHGDLDVGIPRADTRALHAHLAGRYDVWAADRGTLRPLVRQLGLDPGPTCSNLWLRRSGADPWEFDVVLTDVSGADWVYKRDHRIRRPLDEILVLHDGVRYLRPEVQLLHKAPGLRAKDDADFAACLDLLDDAARTWLAEALRTAHPGHPWLHRLGAPAA